MAVHASPSKALAAELSFLVIAFVFVALRIYIRIVHFRRLTGADVATILAWCCHLISSVGDTLSMKHGLWDPRLVFGRTEPDFQRLVPDNLAGIVKSLKMLYASSTIYYLGIFAIKIAFLLQYFGFFPPSRRNLRIALYILTILVVIGAIISTILNMVYCYPIKRNWSVDNRDMCVGSVRTPVYAFTNVYHIITELLIYMLPFWLLPSLLWKPSWNMGTPPPHHRGLSRSLGPLITIFSLGFMCVVMTLARMIAVGDSTTLSFFAAISSAELGLAIAVCCSFTIKKGWDIIRSRCRQRKLSASKSESSKRGSNTDQLKNKREKPKSPAIMTRVEDLEQNAGEGETSGSRPHRNPISTVGKTTLRGTESTAGRSFMDGIEEDEVLARRADLAPRDNHDGGDPPPPRASRAVVLPSRSSLLPVPLGTSRPSSTHPPGESGLKRIDEKGLALGNLTFGDPEGD